MATLLRKIDLLRGLRHGEVARTAGPFFVDVDLTNRCNLRCLGCQYHSPVGPAVLPPQTAATDAPRALLERICEDFSRAGTRTVVLQGAGEPFIRRDIVDIIAMFKRAGFEVVILTNGTLLDGGILRALIDLRVDALKVSLWPSLPPESEDDCRAGSPGDLEKVVDALEQTAALKAERRSVFPRVSLNHTIHARNAHSILRVVDIATRAGCNGLSFSPFRTMRGSLSSLAIAPEHLGVVKRRLAEAKARLEHLAIDHNVNQALRRFDVGAAVWDVAPCYVGWYHARIRIDGAVNPCGSSRERLGNLNDQPWGEIWNGPEYRRFRRRTISREGLASVSEAYDCSYCCFLLENEKVHRVYRWLSRSS